MCSPVRPLGWPAPKAGPTQWLARLACRIFECHHYIPTEADWDLQGTHDSGYTTISQQSQFLKFPTREVVRGFGQVYFYK
jgi:hypothetical protein